MKRMKALEDSARLTTDLKETLRHLSDNVAALHQAVVEVSTRRNEAMPWSVRWAIWTPSVLVTIASCVWLAGHLAQMAK